MRHTEQEISIIMADYSTRQEAINHLDRGTVIFYSFEEYREYVEESDAYEGETIDDIRHRRIRDVSAVSYDGQEYIIVYCL